MSLRPVALSLSFALAVTLAALPARAGFLADEDDPFFEPNIPDYAGNDDLYTDVLHRTIDLSGAPAGSLVTDVEIRVDLHHTYVGDLRVWIETAGGSDVLWVDMNTPDGDGIHRSFWAETEFDGQNPNQTWHLYVKDEAAQDTGELESWSITVWYSDCAGDWDCGVDELCVSGSCAVASCGELGYPAGECSGVDADGECSDDGFEAWECVAVGRLACWELRADCSVGNGICTDPWLSAATCVFSGASDFCARLADFGYGCEHGESDCDNDGECVSGLECMGPIGGPLDGCCEPGEAWDGAACVAGDCASLGYPEGDCGSTGTDGECSADFAKVLECTDVGPANCWVVRDTCMDSEVCWDGFIGAALCVDDGHDDYCKALVVAGSACFWGESDCDSDGECTGDLECKGPLVGGRDGCCNADEDWNGAACVATDCVTLGYPQGGCTTVGTDGRCSADGSEVWECVDAGTVNCWSIRQTCTGTEVCLDPTFGPATCIGAGHGDYCAALVSVGRRCAYGQSDCDSDAQCGEGLECQGPIWPLPGDDGCCPADENWDGETCGAQCEAECVAGTSGCANPTRAWTCAEANDGDSCLDRVNTECTAAQSCRDGRCVAASACTTSVGCPAGEHCASYGRCAPDVCPQGTAYCRGSDVMQCNDDGSGASVLAACGAGAVCVGGACGCVSDAGCPNDEHCAEAADATPFFTNFTGAAGEPAWTVAQGDLNDIRGTLLCVLDPRAVDNVAEFGGAAALTVPADLEPPLCGQMLSARADLGPGALRARVRAPGDSHTQGEIALRRGNAWIALRFEGGGQTVTLGVSTPDGREETRRYTLGFDASAAPHVYGFDWEAGSIALVVDDIPVADVTQAPGLTEEGGAIRLTHWTAKAPHALDGPPTVAATMVVDWVSWAPWPSACQGDVCPAGLQFCEGLQRRQCDARGASSAVVGEPCPSNCSGGVCIGACASAAQCAPDEYCGANGRCVPDVCSQDPARRDYCEGNLHRRCRDDGSASELIETCENGCRGGACLGAGGCLDDAGCPAEQYCDAAGACANDLCLQGQTYCEGLERRLCLANGSGSNLIEACPVACEGGRCVSQCVDDSGCAANQFCEGVRCLPDLCEQDKVYCNGAERRRCSANGSGSELLEVCQGGCQNGVCGGGPCEPACRGRECGDDGCGATCGACAPNWACSDRGVCEPACAPVCGAKQCGDDGCGGSCGTCPAGATCNADGLCVADPTCTPDCVNRECGDDGCGGTCGTCPAGESCNANAQCAVDFVPPSGTDATGGADTGAPPFVSGESSGGCATGAGALPTAPWALLLLGLGLALGLARRRGRA